MLLPSKLKSGEKFKDTVVKRINQIIDYLKTQRLSGDLNTIKINQNTSGITISALPQNAVGQSSSKGGGLNNFPFKISLITDTKEGEETEVNPQYFLSVQNGRVQINDYTNNRSYFYYSGNKKISLSSLTDGQYYVMALIQFQPFGANDDPQEQNRYFSSCIFFTSASATTISTPQTRGIFTTPIGKIKLSTEDGVKKYEVIEQKIIGDFNIDFQALRLPFSVTATFSIADGDLINNINFDDFTFYINKGNFLYDQSEFLVDRENLGLASDSFIYFCTDKKQIFEIRVQTTKKDFYDKDTKTFYYQIANVYYDGGTGIVIEQNITSDITAGEKDTYKVKTKQEDEKPLFLSEKIDFQNYTEDDYKGESQYIGKEFKQYTYTEGQTQIKGFNIVPRWLYKNISGYSTGSQQVLKNDKGALKWAKADNSQIDLDVNIKDSLANYVSADVNKDQDGNFTVDVTFDASVSGYSFMTVSGVGDLQHWTPNVTGTGVITFGNSPSVLVAPQATNNINLYALTGVNGSLSWTQALQPINFGKVKLSSTDSYDFVQNKMYSDSGSISVGMSSIGNYITIDIQDGYFISSDDSIKFETITEHLDLTIPNLGKIKLTDDGNFGFLQQKLIVDSSISALLTLEVVGQQLVIKSAIQGSGLLKVENGVVSVLSAPNEKSVLVGDANGFSWMGIAECETACNAQENDDPNIPPIIQE